jgi:hypothetical protein
MTSCRGHADGPWAEGWWASSIIGARTVQSYKI